MRHPRQQRIIIQQQFSLHAKRFLTLKGRHEVFFKFKKAIFTALPQSFRLVKNDDRIIKVFYRRMIAVQQHRQQGFSAIQRALRAQSIQHAAEIALQGGVPDRPG